MPLPTNDAGWQRVDYASLHEDFPSVASDWAPPVADCHRGAPLRLSR